jgi:hypothetical protein
MIEIRKAITSDWLSIKKIYESGIETGIATFEVSAPSWEVWDSGHLSFGRLVAIIDNEIVGFRIIGHRERIGKLKNEWKSNYIFERRSETVGIE